MLDDMLKYSIIIPCYKSADTIEKVVELTMDELQEKTLEFILVNDASPDERKTYKSIRSLTEKYDNVIGIDLAKNVGQHNAIMCALYHTSGDYVICMDDDLQTHPSQIHKLINKLDEGFDVVFAQYPQRKQRTIRNIESRVSSWTASKLIGKPKNLRTSSFWIAKRFVRDYIIKYRNSYPFIPGLILRTTSNIGSVDVEHFKRESGESGYRTKTLIKLWARILGFSVKPLRIASVLGTTFATIGLVETILVILKKLIFHTRSEGWSSLIAAICFFSGVILLFMGLIGEYLGRMYLDSGNNPQFVIREIIDKNKVD